MMGSYFQPSSDLRFDEWPKILPADLYKSRKSLTSPHQPKIHQVSIEELEI